MTDTFVLAAVFAVLAALVAVCLLAAHRASGRSPSDAEVDAAMQAREEAIALARTHPGRFVHAPKPAVSGTPWRVIVTILACATVPVAVLWCLPLALLLGIYVLWTYSRGTHRRYGADSAVAVDILASLIIIPLVGLVATVGTSWAFYVLSIAEPDERDWQNDGWIVLMSTVLASGALISMFARAYARHRNGTSNLIFEPDTDAAVGLVDLRDLRSGTVTTWLPAVRTYAFTFAEARLGTPDTHLPVMNPLDVLRAIQDDRGNRWPAGLTLAAVICWFVAVPLGFGGSGLLPVTIALGTLTLLLMVAVAYLYAAGAALDYLRLGRRAQVLESRLRNPPEDARCLLTTDVGFRRVVDSAPRRAHASGSAGDAQRLTTGHAASTVGRDAAPSRLHAPDHAAGSESRPTARHGAAFTAGAGVALVVAGVLRAWWPAQDAREEPRAAPR